LENFRRRDVKPAAAKGEKEVSPTRLLADYLISARPEELPTKVRREGARTLSQLDWLCGRRIAETMDIAIQALMPFSGPPQATVLGRTERFDERFSGDIPPAIDFQKFLIRPVNPDRPRAPQATHLWRTEAVLLR